MTAMRLTSPAFENGKPIPLKYGKNFGNISPALNIHDVPEGTGSLVLLMIDPDIPEGKNPEGLIRITTEKNNQYNGPAPPDREHRYYFNVYALRGKVGLKEGATIA